MAAASVPALYVSAWAALNAHKPEHVSEDQWRLALDDGERFLDGWGQWAVALSWSPGDLFDVPDGDRRGGLIWYLCGERVGALGPDHARMSDERTFDLKG